jgi:glycosyltransferase involved in cell wall biosynthesis
VSHARELGAPVRLAVVGDGALRPELEALAAELGIGDVVFFAGYRADMVPVAAAGDLAVLSSDNEGTPVSLIEAAAAGLPAVATDVGGVAEVVDSQTGRLVAAGDTDALGAALAELGCNPRLRSELGAASRERVLDRFSVERLVGEIESLYESLVGGTART